MKRLAALFIALMLPACGGAKTATACAPSDTACLTRVLETHAVRDAAFWATALQQPLGQRIGPAPAALLDYLALENQRSGFKERPRAPVADAGFLSDLRAAFDALPPVVHQQVQHKLAGIYLVRDLGGTGFAEQAYDRQGLARVGVIVLDQDRLASTTANGWASWKENTPFAPKAGYRLEVRIAEPADDNRRRAIQYILLHELGHVVSIGERYLPNWNRPPTDAATLAGYPFFQLSWLPAADGTYVSRFDAAFTLRRQVAYYGNPRLSAAEQIASYQQLQNSNFPTLYAATHFTDDFAESYANYVHTVLMGQPFGITLHAPEAQALQYGPCWQETRCAAKRAMMDALFAAPGAST